jgi:hypothetical protein
VAYAILPKTKRPTKRLRTMGDALSDITRLERPGTLGFWGHHAQFTLDKMGVVSSQSSQFGNLCQSRLLSLS